MKMFTNVLASRIAPSRVNLARLLFSKNKE
jgi:hypothetical protein